MTYQKLKELESTVLQELEQKKDFLSYIQDRIDTLKQSDAAPRLPERWQPEHGARYYYIDDAFNVLFDTFTGSLDRRRWNVFNCFPTYEEAKREARRTRARRNLEWMARELNRGKLIVDFGYTVDYERDVVQYTANIGEVLFCSQSDAEYALSQMTTEDIDALR